MSSQYLETLHPHQMTPLTFGSCIIRIDPPVVHIHYEHISTVHEVTLMTITLGHQEARDKVKEARCVYVNVYVCVCDVTHMSMCMYV